MPPPARAGPPTGRAPLRPLQPDPRHAEATGTLAKTDRVDAAMLARMGALLELEPRAPTPQVQAELNELHRARIAVQADQLAAENRARAAQLPLLRRQATRTARAAERAVAEIDAAMATLIAADPGLARKAAILVSIPGLGQVTAAAILAEMPEIGTLDPGQAGQPLRHRADHPREFGCGRDRPGSAVGAPACAAPSTCRPPPPSAVIPDLKATYDRLRANGKPFKLALTAVMRKLLILANALIRDDRTWAPAKPAWPGPHHGPPIGFMPV